MKVYRGSRGIAPLINDLGTRCWRGGKFSRCRDLDLVTAVCPTNGGSRHSSFFSLVSSLYRDCLSSEARWPGREDDQSCPDGFGINSVSSYTYSAHMPVWSDTWLSKGTVFLLIFSPSQSKQLMCLRTAWYKLIFQKISKCQVSKVATIWQQLTQHEDKITCRFEFDIGPVRFSIHSYILALCVDLFIYIYIH